MGWLNPFGRRKREAKGPLRASSTLSLPRNDAEPARYTRPWIWHLLGLVLAVAAIAGAIYGIRTYLANSPRYRLRNVVINTQTLNEDDLRTFLHVEIGTPIFDIDLAARRRNLLSISTIASARVTRRLPDTLVVEISERDPIARLGRTNLMVDRDGTVFVLAGGSRLLPIITGYQGRGGPLAPGDRATGMLAAAIELLRFAGDGEGCLPMMDIDLSSDDYLLCTLTDQRQARIAWADMASRSDESRADLRKRVVNLLNAMNDPRSAGHSLFDASIDPNTVHAY